MAIAKHTLKTEGLYVWKFENTWSDIVENAARIGLMNVSNIHRLSVVNWNAVDESVTVSYKNSSGNYHNYTLNKKDSCYLVIMPDGELAVRSKAWFEIFFEPFEDCPSTEELDAASKILEKLRKMEENGDDVPF